ncbi:hypothetical protein C8250_029795 [Streptomyces sp. So13.3]|uniref:hypothetical protein n=1 Tax=Streptomyces TaxID=1883 RepID=UPI001106B784|nr:MULTISPECIES: hypothetical protein [Streptomyces]MCZ4098368.1 hypothetical protein [Streptomyces sp. H39-C1]NEA74970.1 hypothetical protein [Streptomyces sp. SID13588]QNA75522.1 hypothetical protein C8250_029795 [Streptomyces sp. So13.3]
MYELELHKVRATELQRRARDENQARAVIAVRRSERQAQRAARREGRVNTDAGRVGRALRGVRHHAAS